MVKSILFKNLISKIKRSLGRYLSLLLIIVVGVGFYAGIQITAPNIQHGAYNLYKDTKLYDIRLISTLGFSPENLEAIQALPGIEAAISTYSADATSKDQIIRIHGISDQINTIHLSQGRLPRKTNEAIGDSSHYKIGDKVILEEADDTLIIREFEIVGLTNSSLYLSDSYGSSHRGNGTLTSYLFALPESFDTSIISEISIRILNSNKILGSESYRKEVLNVEKAILSLRDVEIANHLNGIKQEAFLEIDKNQNELDLKKKEAEDTFALAYKEIQSNQQSINKGFQEIYNQESQLEATYQSTKDNLTKKQQELDASRYTIISNLKKLGIEEVALPDTLLQLDSLITETSKTLESLDPNSLEYSQLNYQLQMSITQREGLEQMANGLASIDQAQTSLTQGFNTLEEQTREGRTKLSEAKRDLQANQNKLSNALSTLKQEEQSALTELNKAQAKIDEARAEVDSIEPATWHLFDRDNSGAYKELESSVGVISSVAAVFPIFFILIAALMTSNSMTRMIQEERSELGALSSLGFRNQEIAATYAYYGLSIAILGVLIGYALGIYTIPPLIYSTFSKFRIPQFAFMLDIKVFMLSLMVSIILMLWVSIKTCNKTLEGTPASLLRTLAPQSGKRILIERINFIWDKLSFSWKVTVRNIFRYKKRGIMTLIGISGCTALLVVGFGLKDSINGVETVQYQEIFKYESMITLHDSQSSDIDSLKHELEGYGIDTFSSIKQVPYTATPQGQSLEFYMIAMDSSQNYQDYLGLKRLNGNAIKQEDSFVAISQKMADILNVSKGDMLTIQNRDFTSYELKITDIIENYIGHYLFIDETSYTSIIKEPLVTNTVLTNFELSNENDIVKTMIEDQFAINVTTSDEMASSIKDTNESLVAIVILIVVVASLLALVVLYNLTSINISERKRELATLKVLGFYDSEANGYIYREALILTLLSTLLGLVLGIVLHGYVLIAIETSGIKFFNEIKPMSFIYAALITIALSSIMQFITFKVIQQINMIEALKSNE